ncbi:MAG: hypothetical protein R3F20_18345 [Planctomycetota bacterium]
MKTRRLAHVPILLALILAAAPLAAQDAPPPPAEPTGPRAFALRAALWRLEGASFRERLARSLAGEELRSDLVRRRLAGEARSGGLLIDLESSGRGSARLASERPDRHPDPGEPSRLHGLEASFEPDGAADRRGVRGHAEVRVVPMRDLASARLRGWRFGVSTSRPDEQPWALLLTGPENAWYGAALEPKLEGEAGARLTRRLAVEWWRIPAAAAPAETGLDSAAALAFLDRLAGEEIAGAERRAAAVFGDGDRGELEIVDGSPVLARQEGRFSTSTSFSGFSRVSTFLTWSLTEAPEGRRRVALSWRREEGEAIERTLLLAPGEAGCARIEGDPKGLTLVFVRAGRTF